MYEKFYGFKEKPFNTTPDSRFFFPSPKHSEALNSLIYAINERKGFVVITGEIGAGKTTVCRTLISKIDANTKIALITNTHLTPKELIATILDDLEVDYKQGGKAKLLAQLNGYLITQLAQNCNVVLIIDEAQNLTPKVLEEVRMLSNLETETEKLIQIILMGQPQLKKKLEMPELLQFRQRVAVHYHLYPLDEEETQGYIQHRLSLVSNDGKNIFSKDALNAIYLFSKGVPRVINLICDSALLTGFINESREINEGIIREVVSESRFDKKIVDKKETFFVEPKQEDTKTASDNKIHCCAKCQDYDSCETKWFHAVEGKENLCCPKCEYYQECLEENTNKHELHTN